MLGSWRLAARLARRETRRRPGRALLVVLLIAVPVFGLTVADVLVETAYHRSGSESFRRSYGPASVVFDVDGVADPRFASALPTGSTVVRYASAELPLTPARGQGLRPVRVLNLGAADSPAFAGLQLTKGRNAQGGELVMSRGVARWLGVDIGDSVRFSRPAFLGRVVGIARSMEDFRTPILIAPSFDFGVVRQPGLVRTRVAVELPHGSFVSRSLHSTLDRFTLHARGGTEPFPTLFAGATLPDAPGVSGATVPAQFGDGSTVPAQARFWGWVAVALLLAGIGVIISAAFATTAVRQLVTLGLLAANGGDPRFLRTMLTLQGTVLGAIGAALGVTAGLAGLLFAQNWIEGLYHHQLNYVVNFDLGLIALTAIGAATIAARFPARSTSRVPVLAALGGRRPLAPVPALRWLKATTIFGAGLGLLALVAVWSRDKTTSQPQTVALVAITGGLLVMAGAAYLAPVVVELQVKGCSRLGPAARIAARSLVRVRSRSAAVVTAGAIAGGLAIAVVTAMLGLGTGRDWERNSGLPANVVTITSQRVVDGLSSPLPGELLASQRVAEGVLPGVKFANIEGFLASPVGAADVGPTTFPVFVDSPQVRRLLVLPDAAQRALDRDGAVWDAASFATVTNASGEPPGEPQSVTLRVGVDGPTFTAPARRVGRRAHVGAEAFVIVSPERVRSLGVTPLVFGLVGVSPKSINEAQQAALYGGQIRSDPYGTQTVADTNPAPVQFQVGSGDTIPAFWRGFWNPARLQLWIAGLASLFVLLVVGIGLLLGAAEGADERTVLDALGAKPKSRRRMSATNAYLLAAGGAVLALPTGFIPIAVVFQAVQKPSGAGQWNFTGSLLYPRVEFPWIAAIAIVVVLPIVAAFLAWVGSAAAQRTRPILGTAGFGTD